MDLDSDVDANADTDSNSDRDASGSTKLVLASLAVYEPNYYTSGWKFIDQTIYDKSRLCQSVEHKTRVISTTERIFITNNNLLSTVG